MSSFFFTRAFSRFCAALFCFGSSAGAHAALALKLFVLFQYASPEINKRYAQEAERRLQPTPPTLIDALEVEMRTRFHALVVS